MNSNHKYIFKMPLGSVSKISFKKTQNLAPLSI